MGASGGRVGPSVLAELGAAARGRPCCRRAEAAALVQFSGGPRIEGPRLRVTAGSSTAGARLAVRLRELSGAPPVSVRRARAGHLVAVDRAGRGVVAAVGLLDTRGRLLPGLPPAVVQGRDCDAAAVWRAAVLTAGRLIRSGRIPALVVACPGPALGLALAGAARRLGAAPRTTTATLMGENADGGEVLVTVAGAEPLAALLARIGAPAAAADLAAAGQRQPRAASPAAFTGTNAKRAAAFAGRATAQARADLAVLGEHPGGEHPDGEHPDGDDADRAPGAGIDRVLVDAAVGLPGPSPGGCAGYASWLTAAARQAPVTAQGDRIATQSGAPTALVAAPDMLAGIDVVGVEVAANPPAPTTPLRRPSRTRRAPRRSPALIRHPPQPEPDWVGSCPVI